MTYRIIKTNGESLIELEDEIIDNETVSGVGLIGYMTPNYGETQSNNFVHIIENFADKKFPENPLEGQIVYRKTDTSTNGGDLYLCIKKIEEDTLEWIKLPKVYVNENKPETLFDTGDIWFNDNDKALYIYDSKNDEWVKIGPNNSDDYSSYIDTVEMITPNEPIIVDLYDFYKNLSNSSYLIDINIICKEITNVEPYTMSNSSTSAWKYSMLVNCYLNANNELISEFVDAPNYQLIGTNNTSHQTNINIANNKLQVSLRGNFDNNKKMIWKIQKNILKVG